MPVNGSVRCAWFAAFIAASSLLCPSALALDPRRPIASYQHTRWGAAEGAPAIINAITQDRYGYLIVGAATGLYRFDGVTFELIRPDDAELTQGRVVHLLRGKDDRIWAFYDTGQVATYRNGRLKRDPTIPKIPAKSPAGAAQTPDGDLWMDGSGAGTAILRRHNGRWHPLTKEAGLNPSEWANIFLAARDGSLWISTNHSLLVKRKGSERFETLKPAILRTVLSQDRRGQIWASDSHGTVALDAHGRSMGQVYPTPTFQNFTAKSLFDRDGNLWMANGHEIVRVRTPGRPARSPDGRILPAVEQLGASDGVGANTTMFEDREGNIWVGTSRALHQFRDVPIVLEPMLATTSAGSQINLFAASDGTVYMAVGQSLFRARPGAAPEKIARLAASADCLTETNDGAIWLFEFDRVVRLHKGVATEMVRSKDLAAFGVYDDGGCAADNHGTTWVSRFYPENPNSGLISVRDRILHYHPQPASRWPVAIARGRGGTPIAWLANGQVVELGADGRFTNVLARSVPKSVIYMLAMGTKGPFLGGGFGLARIWNRQLQIIDANRFPWIASATGITESPDGRTWMITPAGIVVMDSKALDMAFNDVGAPLKSRVLSFEDGLPEIRSPLARVGVARGGDGRIWFATFAGVARIDPAEIKRDIVPPPVHIGALTAGSRVYPDPPSSITLAPGTSKLAIRYAGLSLSVPSRVKFRYRLQGLDSGWVEAGTRREAFYTNLRAGTYAFSVLASNSDDVWSNEATTLKITISPSFVETIWFKLIGAAGLGLVIWLLIQVRTRVVQHQLQDRFDVRNAERERIARALHDTLLQSVQGMVYRFQSVADSLGAETADRKRIEEALDQADALIVEGRNQVQALRVAADSPPIAEALRQTLPRLAGNGPTALQVTVVGKERALKPAVSAELLKIAEEAVRNAIRHAAARSIDVSLAFAGNEATLRILDDGIGIAPEVARAGRDGHFGLPGMRERAEQLRGRCLIGPRAGGGTEISATIPGRFAFQRHLPRPVEGIRRMWGYLGFSAEMDDGGG